MSAGMSSYWRGAAEATERMVATDARTPEDFMIAKVVKCLNGKKDVVALSLKSV